MLPVSAPQPALNRRALVALLSTQFVASSWKSRGCGSKAKTWPAGTLPSLPTLAAKARVSADIGTDIDDMIAGPERLRHDLELALGPFAIFDQRAADIGVVGEHHHLAMARLGHLENLRHWSAPRCWPPARRRPNLSQT